MITSSTYYKTIKISRSGYILVSVLTASTYPTGQNTQGTFMQIHQWEVGAFDGVDSLQKEETVSEI